MGSYKVFNLDHHGICTKDKGCTWEECNQVCEKEGGYLVKITSKEENDQIKKIMSPFSKNFWIGLDDIKTESHYRWVSDNSPIAYHNFGNNICVTFVV